MKNIENKKELIAAARLALTVPQEQEFWDEVRERLDAEEKHADDLVKKRNLRD